MTDTACWRTSSIELVWPPTSGAADQDRVRAFLDRVQRVLARLEVALVACSPGDLIAVVFTERVRRTDDGSYPPISVVAATLRAAVADESDDVRFEVWTRALDLALAPEAPPVVGVVLALVLQHAFRAVIAHDPPPGARVALTGVADLCRIEVAQALEQVISGAISPASYWPM